MPILRVLCLALVVLAVPARAHALSYYLTLPGITGEAAPGAPAGSITLLSFSLAPNSFSFVKETDSASPALFLAASKATLFATAEVGYVDTTVSPSVPIAMFAFESVLISSIAPVGGGGAIPREAISLTYASGGAVPEPASALLVALGCVALGAGAHRRRAD